MSKAETALGPPREGRLERRLGRERAARAEAEAIAEDATRRLYRLVEELQASKRELERANEAQRDFVAIASHELLTPVAPIEGFADTLLARWHSLPEDDKLSFLEAIGRQAKRLSRLASDLLATARIDSSTVAPSPRPVDLGAVLELWVADAAVRHETVVACAAGLVVLADPDHLHRIVVNLVANASRHGAPPIGVEARDGGAWAELRVRDSGDGVSPELLPRLFERFGQVPHGSGATHEGTGLGLYIVRGLARAQGGEAWYEPNVPRGACFAVRLPKPPIE